MIHHYVKKGLLLFALVLLNLSVGAQLITPFNSVYSINQRGGIVFLSNAALGCAANPPASTGACLAGSLDLPLTGLYRNNDYASTYIDIDGDAGTFMSSSDRLDLPACSKITRAILFWAASGNNTPGLTQVKLKINTGAYQTVTAAVSQTNSTGYDSYHCYADVTSLLPANGLATRITIADIPSSQIGQTNTFGSWNLVVVYENEFMTMRQLTVYNGLAYVSVATPTINVPLSGFLTPTLGAVGFEVGVYSHDGDRGVLGDNLLFKGNAAFMPLTDLITNPANDVMNSTVSYAGIENPFRLPLLDNTTGSDADIYVPLNLLNAYLGNATNTATLMLTTSGDGYLTQAITTAIDSYEPRLRSTVRARDVNGGTLNPGDIIEYRIRGTNYGTDASVNTFLTDTLDANVTYIPNSTSIVYGPNTGNKTDAAGDDQVDYNPLTRILKIRIGAGANASAGGTILGLLGGADSTVVTYSVAVTQSCLRLSCNNTINASAYISGTGFIFPTHTYTIASTPGTVDGLGCRNLGPTTLSVSATACATPTASSSSPVCAGRNLLLTASADTDASYRWSGPGSYTSSVRNPTIIAATASLSGLYTVSLSIPGSTCSAVASTNATITVCTPTAVNDFTNTTAGVPVIANAATNDLNAIPGGTFSILNQPTGGTVTVNAATGQFTFAPNAGFTGVTTATYQLCNSLPAICVTAVITVTVYPTLVANPDAVNTTPSVTTTGNFLANDSGTATGVTYSVNTTVIPPSTGTLTVNPATGQYTFIPNNTFTGSAVAGYTVCNISVNPPQCSSSSFSINVLPNPVPANDNITTFINTTVTANAATNDLGAAGGTFAIVNQPSSGTITINASTGQFTYTPATNFTGVTTATYNLCNGAPVTCSTAVISITVFPTLVANPDIINTAPGVNTSGSLLANDSGTATGISYSVTFTQLASGTGTLTVNAATGQYTFVPNNTFTGTAQTSYTVCNTTANPQQCSSAIITINARPNPAPANDNISTVLNTSVTANAAANDLGTASGTFVIVNQPSSGSIVMNAATGQFTYTPGTGFTGVTTATYNLCNGAPVTCAPAVITITVYPNLVANPDIIDATPTASVTGSLLANDNGTVTGVTYSVSVTPIASSTGTLNINTATGQYTFIPNPSFTGSVQTTYTVCNISTNPSQCSSTSITINAEPNPVPVNDNITTVINMSVTGNAAANDLGTANGTFSIVSQPSGGAIVMNAATGQFTYTPPAGFTGITNATYNLCNGSPVTCSTAVISITVYPNITAIADIINTTPTATNTGSLLANDIGITAGATYSISYTQLPTSTGTLTVNSITGQYTVAPNPLFTGSSQTSYTVCNVSVNPSQCSSTTITINAAPNPNPVNDIITTVVNIPVTGNVGTNDIGATGGTFAIVSQPASGTIAVNASTGQFTYTPGTGFTGITTATYNLCNGAPVTCSTAVISITVYPNVTANPDIINTTPLITTTGNLLSNDGGIINGGVYSVSITQPAPSTGTIVLNTATGQYTFIPNLLFTGTAVSSYTVCNIDVSPQQCSSTTFTIMVTNLPVAINDATTTIINTPVSGNVATNDSGTLLGTFTFGSTSASTGTITGNPVTGAFTFTPAPGFTGVTSTTYTLCNLLSPPCSTASITFTVFPMLVAVADVINTTPSISVLGNFTGNDTGIIPGANYNVSVTQPAPGAGTITVNAITGQYTFVPNPLFIGTAQASYTICNVSVNPQQCSSANITVNVKPNPRPFDDNISTTINHTVTGNAATNDLGTATGTFAIVNQPANGTITINAATGQFTFTPALNFTGVTTATYNLCNGAPSSCSTAVINVTVFPALVANPDAVSTTPSVSTSGNLLSNDTGINPGATYSVSITQPAASTGTFIINSATGSYTFIPNPSFMGLAQTSYTVCNISVTPQECSNTTINIAVGNLPVAVNDNTITLINTAVSGNVSTNDSNFAGGTFNFGTPSTGTLTANNSTGQYTYTPAAGFTGIASVAYTLCTMYSPPCATALLSFTVYPAIVANPETITTVINASVTGNFETNDTGISPNGTYSIHVAGIAPGIGVISTNTATGQYTFVPATGFTGSTTTSYTLVQYNGSVQLQSSVTTVTIIVTNSGSPVGIAKSISNVSYNTDGTINLTYKIVVKNYSNQQLNNVSVTDNLASTFPLPATYTVTSAPYLNNASGSGLALQSGYTGSGSSTLLTLPLNSILDPGRVDSVLFTVKVDPHGAQVAYDNSASTSAVASGSTVTDVSADGLNPDPDNDGDPGNNSSVTTFTFNLVKIGIAKYTGRTQSIGNGCYEVTFKFTVKNYGASPIYNIQVLDNLDNAFGSQASYTVLAPVTSANGYLAANNLFDGSANANMTSSASTLGTGKTDTLMLRVRYCSSSVVSFTNTAIAYGNSMPGGGFIGHDQSTSGLDPDPNHDNNPDENDVTTFTSSEDFMIPQGFSPNSDGINDRFEIKGLKDYPNLEVTILNRWGTTVYHKKQYDNSWDGKATEGVEFGGNDLPEGTYFYIIDLGTDQKAVKGYVYLNRAVR